MAGVNRWRRLLVWGANGLCALLAFAWLISLPSDYGPHLEDFGISCREGRALVWYGKGQGRRWRSSDELVLDRWRFDLLSDWDGAGFRLPYFQVIDGTAFLTMPFWFATGLALLGRQLLVRGGAPHKMENRAPIISPSMRRVFAGCGLLSCTALAAATWYSIGHEVEYTATRWDANLNNGKIGVHVHSPAPAKTGSGCLSIGWARAYPSLFGSSSTTVIPAPVVYGNTVDWGPLKIKTKLASGSNWRDVLGLVSPSGGSSRGFGPIEYSAKLPIWMLLSLVSAFTLFVWAPWRRRFPLGCCTVCGYNLTGNVSGRCPECGTAIREEDSEGQGSRLL